MGGYWVLIGFSAHQTNGRTPTHPVQHLCSVRHRRAAAKNARSCDLDILALNPVSSPRPETFQRQAFWHN